VESRILFAASMIAALSSPSPVAKMRIDGILESSRCRVIDEEPNRKREAAQRPMTIDGLPGPRRAPRMEQRIESGSWLRTIKVEASEPQEHQDDQAGQPTAAYRNHFPCTDVFSPKARHEVDASV